jgi:hypothetical protein
VTNQLSESQQEASLLRKLRQIAGPYHARLKGTVAEMDLGTRAAYEVARERDVLAE